MIRGCQRNRREFLASAASVALMPALIVPPRDDFPPVRTITQGPKHHWFGYYDKLQFDVADRFVLGNQVDFEHRTPTADDEIQVGMVDIQDQDRWIELGSTRAWCWQQGCMLQWRPGNRSQVVWNDREEDRFVCRILDVESKQARTLPQPIYTMSPDGQFALSADFAQIQVMRPGYGYVGLPDRFADQLAPRDSGVFKVDMETSESSLVLPLQEVAQIPHNDRPLGDVWHYFNHLLINPAGRRFIVLHRWRAHNAKTGSPAGGFTTRMITADIDGSNLYVLDPSGNTSHFIWRDETTICMWTQPSGKPAGFYLFRDRTHVIEPVGRGVMTENGHNTYLPKHANRWILCDTYPDADRNQKPYLFDVQSNRKVPLGQFRSPPEYRGEWRCDTHPRSSRSGRLVCIDSPHNGQGRQLHLIDISQIVDG